MSLLSRSRTFRMDCFACISKTEVSSRRNVAGQNRTRKRPVGTSASNNENVLEVIRFPVQPPPLLIVSEHARGFWLASAEDSGYQNKARQHVVSQKLALIRLDVSIGTGK